MNENALLTPVDSDPPEAADFDSRAKRAAYASNYYEKCQDLVSDLSLANLRAVDQALSKVDSADIDIEEAERLVQCLGPLLSPSIEPEVVLNACQLVVKLRVRKPESLWMSSADVAERAASSFRDLSLQLASSSGIVPAEFKHVVDSWSALVGQGKLEEHLSFPIMTSALQWIFGENRREAHDARASFVSFIAASYAHISQTLQDQILHEVLSVWFRHSCSASSDAANTMTELILSLVAVAGEVPAAVWEEAVTLKSRSKVEAVSQQRHSKAVAVANLISRRLIDFTWAAAKTSAQRAGFQRFLESCASALLSPQWPAAEVFLSALVSSLLKLATVIRSQKYPGFMFDSLHTLYDALAELSDDSGNNEAGQTSAAAQAVCKAVSLCIDDHQAAYLASRQSVLPNQPFYDLYDAYVRRSTAAGAQRTVLDRASWLKVLAQFPIYGYRDKIARLACELAGNEELKEQHQIELFRLVEKVVKDNIQLFRIEWFDRISYAAPAVCDALVPVAASAYNQSANAEVLERICARILGPGAAHYKRRALALLHSAATHEIESDGHEYMVTTLACRYFLVAATDSDASVKAYALSLARSWFNASFQSEIAAILIKAQSGTDRAVVQRGLREYIKDIRLNAGNGADSWVKKLVNVLLAPENKQLDLALMFIEIDGGFTPLPRVAYLHGLSLDADEKERVLALRILDCALRARPRLILAPSLATEMFSKLLNQLKTCPEASMIHVGSILGQLVSLGGPQVQQQRSAALLAVSGSAFKMAQNVVNSVEEPVPHSQKLVVLRQSVLICGCARFWPVATSFVKDVAVAMVQWAGSSKLETDVNSRLALVRSVFRLSVENFALLSDPTIVAFFESFKEGSPEYACLTRQLLRFMLDSNRPQIGKARDFSRDRPDSLASSSNEDAKRAEAATTLMVQRHVGKLLRLVQSDHDVVVLRVVVKAVEDNLLVADECIPVITSLCFSTRPELAQIAARSLMVLSERWPRNFGVKFVEGLKLVNRAGDQPVSHSPLPLMWRIIKGNQKHRNIKPMLDHLAQLFSSRSSYELLRLLIAGLSNVDMDIKDAKYLLLKIDDEVNQFNAAESGQQATVKTIIVYVFALWMRTRYGLSESSRAAGGSAASDEEIEPMDAEYIWHRLNGSEIDAPKLLHELWCLPDYYGSAKMHALVYGRANGSANRDRLEPPPSKRLKS